MSINISIDNDRGTIAIDTLVEDESLGVQTPGTTDTGNELDVTLTNPISGTLGGFQTLFNNFLNGTMFSSFTLSDAQKAFASTHDGASSSSSFVQLPPTASEA